ncbi:YwgA family protein [Neomoorella thermoacetica]
MNILNKYYMLIKLLTAVGEVHGRKKLQKMVYLLQEQGYAFKESFGYHLYGPYSEELSTEVDEMKFLGLLEEKVETTVYGYKQYIYSLSERGKRASDFAGHLAVPDSFEEAARELAQFDARTLELIATLRFLRKINYSDTEAARYVKELKPEQEYKDGEIEKALKFLEEKFSKQ